MTQLVVPELPAFTVAVLTSLMSLVLFLTAGPRESPSLAYLFLLTAFYNMKSSTSDAFATASEMLTTSASRISWPDFWILSLFQNWSCGDTISQPIFQFGTHKKPPFFQCPKMIWKQLPRAVASISYGSVLRINRISPDHSDGTVFFVPWHLYVTCWSLFMISPSQQWSSHDHLRNGSCDRLSDASAAEMHTSGFLSTGGLSLSLSRLKSHISGWLLRM